MARRLLAGTGLPLREEAGLLALFLERRARRHPPLVAAFGDFADGWSALVGAAADLIDAGFEPALAEALAERIEAERGALPGRTLDRARELFAVLAEALGDLDEIGLATGATRLAAAARVVAERGPEAWPATALFLYGFADATGAATELLAAMARHLGATALLIEPGARAGRDGFGARLRERFESVGGRALPIGRAGDESRRHTLVAPDPRREARALARTARAAIDAGRRPEEIGIVLRDPAAARSDLRRELERRGVPFSASAANGPLAPHAYRGRALLRLLDERGDLPADAALELLAPLRELAGEHRAAVRLALRALGVARLREAAQLEVATLAQGATDDGYPLPARAGLAANAEGNPIAPRRRLPWPVLRMAVERLRGLLAAAERWPVAAPWPMHVAALRALVDAAGGEGEELLVAVEPLAAAIPVELELEAREAVALFGNSWSRGERLPWGGAGAGVQVLSVTEARGRTFDLLLLGGLARGRFPRFIAEDPVLPDPLRHRLRELLPDLPIKREGHDEERFLFDQLVGAAPEILLSRPANDADGRPLPPSPLLEAIEREAPLPAWRDADDTPEPALDRAIGAPLAAPDRRESALAPHLAPALEEGRRRFAGSAIADLSAAAAARERVLAEFDADPSTDAGRRRIQSLGPYFGFVGAGEPERAVAATTLEAHARCAWQTFLERTLKLEPTPDPLDALPGLTPLLVGTAVHHVLARLFADRDGSPSLPATVAARSEAPGLPLLWPAGAVVERTSAAVAKRLLADSGLAGRGLEPLLERRVLERLEVARQLDEATAGATLLGVELDGALEVAVGGARPAVVTFRADRLQREGQRLVLVDFKSGKPPDALPLKAEKRAERLRALIASGERLQGALYASALSPRDAEGRYLFLAPDDEETERSLGFPAEPATVSAVARVIDTLLDARGRGLYPPRLLDATLEKEYDGCKWCAVAEACVQRDSGFRVRLERWHDREEMREGERTAREEALWRLWRLPTGDGDEPA